jgi:heptosyltransferase-2
MKTAMKDMPTPRQILVIALPGVGDALLSIPAIRRIKTVWPDAVVDVLVMFKAAEQALMTHPLIRSVLFHDFLKGRISDSLRVVSRLRAIRYDASMLAYPSNRLEYNVIQWMIGARCRVGHRYDHCDLRNLNFIGTNSVREDEGLHNVEEDLRLVELITGVSVPPSCEDRLDLVLEPGDEAFASQWLESRGLGTGRLVGMHAGTAMFKNQIRRRWAPEKFAELAKWFRAGWGAPVLIFGGNEESDLKEMISKSAGGGCHVVSGTTFRQTAALIRRCFLFVSNDSALMHTAAALQVPCVTLFGPTSPARVQPYRAPHRVVRAGLPCSPCFYYSPRPLTCHANLDFQCIRDVSVDSVCRAVVDLAKEIEGGAGGA